MQYRRSVQGRMLLNELETSARTESKRMTNHNTPQLSRMGLLVHCATVPGLSRLNTRAVLGLSCSCLDNGLLGLMHSRRELMSSGLACVRRRKARRLEIVALSPHHYSSIRQRDRSLRKLKSSHNAVRQGQDR
jgi:hypothetical protein